MNPITYACDQVKFRIPKRLLELAFVYQGKTWREAPINIDEAIRNQVIRPRVLIDCNLHGGTEMWVGLEDVPYQRTDDYTSVYRIPKTKTQNRSIISVLNVTFTDPLRASSFGISAGCENSTLMQGAQAVMDAYGMIPITSTAKVQLIGENTVMVRDSMVLPPNIYVRCIVANDENLTHLQLRSFPYFVKLCELAVRSYIFNKLVIEVDIGEIQGGQVIGKIKDTLDSYGDSEQLYQEYMENTFQKVLFQNDQETYNRYLKMMVGGYR
jgi:hypothetical protein